MTCPRCGTANPDGSKFCHQCGAALTGTAPAPPSPTPPGPPAATPPPVAEHHLVVHKRTSGTLWVLITGAVLTLVVLVAAVWAGASFVSKKRQAAPSGPAGVQPRAPGSPPATPPV